MSSWDANNKAQFNYAARSEQGLQNPLMSTGREVVHFSQYGPSSHTPIGVNEKLLPQSRQPSNPSWAPQASQAAPEASESTGALQSCKDQINTTRVVGMIIGLVLTGIPLAVMVTLYLQPVTTTTTGSTTSVSSSTVSNAYSLPSQCTTYTLNQDSTRNYAYYCMNCYCDGLSGWYRFSGAAGTRLISTPVTTGYCGTDYTGWFNGTHPTTVGATSIGTGCVNVNGVLCQIPYSVPYVYVTNCNGFYVYYLTAFSYCYSRYCTI